MPASCTHSRRTMLGILAMAFAPIGKAWLTSQQTIRLNVPFTAGTGPDLLARILGEELRQRWNHRSSSRTSLARAAISARRQRRALRRMDRRCW